MEKTIRDLCKRVAATRGLDTDMESITQYQDLIGHATLEENADIANTPELTETFYRIYGLAYGTVEAIKYYMNNSNKVIGMRYEIDEYKGVIESLKNAEQVQKERAEDFKGKLEEAKRDMDGTMNRISLLEGALAERDAEIVQLKAKLFDLITREA